MIAAASFELLYFLPLLIFVGVPPILAIFYRRWPRMAIFWLITVVLSITAWVLLFLSRLSLPVTLDLNHWRPIEIFLGSPILSIDQISWPYGVALATIAVSMLLTDVIRTYIPEADSDERVSVSWNSWAAGIFQIGLGLVAVFSSNMLALLIGWVAIDIFDFAYRLLRSDENRNFRYALRALSVRVICLLFIMLAVLSSVPSGAGLEFSTLNPQAGFWLILAAGLRLGILPFFVFSSDRPRYAARSVEAVFAFISAAAALSLLARISATTVLPVFANLTLILASLAGIAAGLIWLLSRNSLHGLPAWIAGIGQLAFLSALMLHPPASQAWGIILLLYGSLLVFYDVKHKILSLLLLISLVNLTTLPLTASWPAVLNYQWSNALPIPLVFWLVVLLFAIISQSWLFLGSIRKLNSAPAATNNLERWIWVIYGAGLIILPITSLLIAGFGGFWATVRQSTLSLPMAILPGIIILLVTGIFWFLSRKGMHIPEPAQATILKIFQPNWMIALLKVLFDGSQRVISTADRVLEGAGGILWTLLLIILLATLLAQIARGVWQ